MYWGVIEMGAAKYTKWETEDGLEQIRQWVKGGKSDRQIAELMGTNPQLLSRWRRARPLIRGALTRLVTIDGKRVDAHDVETRGAPRKLDNIAMIQAKVDTWLEECKEQDIPPTRSGLCLMLGVGKDALDQYLHDTETASTVYATDPLTQKLRPLTIADVLKRAILAIEHALEIRMLTSKSNVAGVIFDLKNNHGYADKSETVSTQTITKTTDESEIDARIRELLERQEQARPFQRGKTG